MLVLIKALNGTKKNYEFEPTTTVLKVKEQLETTEGIAVAQIRLIFGGKQLQDDFQLKDYNITGGSTIHMVLQLKGGTAS